MTRVAGLTGLKLAAKSWSSADEMAEEVSENKNFVGGTYSRFYCFVLEIS